jgi:molybdate transport system substrate-binding protein
MNGAPFELFFAANIEYPEKLKAAGQTVGEIKPYAIGRLAILTKRGSGVDVKKGISILTSEQVKKISIANPDVAPYGKAAVEVLKHYGIYEKVQSKLIKGENVQQAANFGITGATDVAVVAHSLALSPTISREIEYYLIDGSAHPKMIQAYTMTKKGAANPSAKNFLAFFESKESDIILKKYGFTLE